MKWGVLLSLVTAVLAWIGWWRHTPDDEVSPHWLDQRERYEMDHAQQIDGPVWTWPLRPDDRELEDDDQQRRRAFSER